MFKKLLFSLMLILIDAISSSASASPDIKQILSYADAYRLSAASALVVTKVDLYQDNQIAETRLYHVFIKPGRRSLVLMKSAAELGQKVLMLDDKFWLILPSSKRPIRITPTQKLLGEASTGDIANMTWSEDYTGQIVGPDTVEGQQTLKLDLQSAREGTTYDHIILWVKPDNYQPISAELYLKSGKLAKIAQYEMGNLNGNPAVVKTYMQDQIQKNKKTVLEIESISAKDIPDKVYNPSFLLRESPEDM